MCLPLTAAAFLFQKANDNNWLWQCVVIFLKKSWSFSPKFHDFIHFKLCFAAAVKEVLMPAHYFQQCLLIQHFLMCPQSWTRPESAKLVVTELLYNLLFQVAAFSKTDYGNQSNAILMNLACPCFN